MLAGLRWFGDTGDARGALRLAVALLWFWLLSGGQGESRRGSTSRSRCEGEADPLTA